MKAHTTITLVAAFLLPLAACQNQTATEKAPPAKEAKAAKAEAPTLEMYVMSQCPYGVQVVNAIALWAKLDGDAAPRVMLPKEEPAQTPEFAFGEGVGGGFDLQYGIAASGKQEDSAKSTASRAGTETGRWFET